MSGAAVEVLRGGRDEQQQRPGGQQVCWVVRRGMGWSVVESRYAQVLVLRSLTDDTPMTVRTVNRCGAPHDHVAFLTKIAQVAAYPLTPSALVCSLLRPLQTNPLHPAAAAVVQHPDGQVCVGILQM